MLVAKAVEMVAKALTVTTMTTGLTTCTYLDIIILQSLHLLGCSVLVMQQLTFKHDH